MMPINITTPVRIFPQPTVDVGFETMIIIFNSRPDIGELYCGNNRPDGTPWCPRGVPVYRDIITDWWTRVAGENDDPALYGNSLARWVETTLGIPIPLQPGTPPVTTPPVQPPDNGGGTRGGVITVGMITVILASLFFIGGKREKMLKFVPDPRYQGSGINRFTGA